MTRLQTLDALFASIAAVRRDDALQEENAAYTELLFAYGFAALGDRVRADALAASARVRLGDLATIDPIHAWLVVALDARITSGDRTRPLPAELLAVELDRVNRYKVDCFCERSRIARGESRPHAFLRFARQQWPIDFDALGAHHVETAERTMALAAEAPIEELRYFVEENLKGADDDPAEYVHRVLELVLPHLERVPFEERGLATARALRIAIRTDASCASALFVDVLRLLEHRTDEMMESLVSTLASRRELAHLLAQLPPSESNPWYIAGLIRIGDPRGLAMYHAHVQARSTVSPDLMFDAVLDAYLERPLEQRFARAWVPELYARVNDGFATRSHFTQSLVELVDRVVLGAVE
jgi:hypothetical protein